MHLGIDELEPLNRPWVWVSLYVVLWWADDLPWVYPVSPKDMKMHLFDAVLYFTPLWGEPYLTNICVKVLIDVNTFLISQSKMQNSWLFQCYSTSEGIDWKSRVSDKERDLEEWNWCQKGIRGKSSLIISLAVFSFTVSRMQQFGHLKWTS